jgi:hypothetical protein
MFKAKHKQRNIRKQIVIALALMLLGVCAINVRFYLKYKAATHTATYRSNLNLQKNLFNMSIEELMEVTIPSSS